jgi:hypothetical protein
MNAAGTKFDFLTYLGGSYDDAGRGLGVDAAGNIYVAGWTASPNFPVVNALQPQLGGNTSYDAFVAKLDPTGRSVLYSTYLGGSTFDIGTGVAVDAAGNAYVTGWATSPNFPTTPGAFQITSRGDYDVFVAKVNPAGTALVYSTRLGSSGEEKAKAIAVDLDGNAYVTGYTDSPDFPLANAFQSVLNNQVDAFVTKLNATGTALIYSTYLGGSGFVWALDGDLLDNSLIEPDARFFSDMGTAITTDAAGNAYVTGYTDSEDFPTRNALQSTYGGPMLDAFVAKFNPTGEPIFSTYLGSFPIDQGFGIAVDTDRNIYVTAATGAGRLLRYFRRQDARRRRPPARPPHRSGIDRW